MNLLEKCRKNRSIQKERNDVYQETLKRSEPACCGECGAVFLNGRWTWAAAPAVARRSLCPACLRIKGRDPAGDIALTGVFFDGHREEILNLVRRVGRDEKAGHPLERIIEIQEGKEGAWVTTTGVHLARRIGGALGRSLKGRLSFHYGDGVGHKSLRVLWDR